MNALRVWLAAGALMLALFGTVQAEEMVGGYGTNWVGSAMTIPAGSAMLTSHGQFWSGKIDKKNYSVATLAGNLNFGYSRRIELGISQYLYQDVNWANKNLTTGAVLGDKYIAPGDLRVSLKYGNLATSFGQLYILHAFQWGVRYRVGQVPGLPLYPYSGEGISGSFQWNASWYSRPLYPEESEFVGFSLGLTHHNDNGSMMESAQSIQWGAAYTHPGKNWSYGAQIHGMFFIKTPVETAYSREPYAYFAPILNFQLLQGLSFSVSPEVLIAKAKEYTKNPLVPKDAPNYTPWRLSTQMTFMPSTTFYANDPFAKSGSARRGSGSVALRERLARESSESLFEWTIDTERDLQFLNLDLEKTRIDRKKAEEELLKLKQQMNK